MTQVDGQNAKLNLEGLDEVLTPDQMSAFMDPRFRWYIVNTYTGSEASVRLALLERIAKAGLQDSFGQICIPKTSVEKVLKSGKKRLIDKTSFPGYIMVQMDMNEITMSCVSTTPRVTGFVGNHRNPRPMPDRDVLKLMYPEAVVKNEEKVSRQKASSLVFYKGERVKVNDGPFATFDGVVEEVRPDKMKIRVLVSIFGRETPVELGYHQVVKLD